MANLDFFEDFRMEEKRLRNQAKFSSSRNDNYLRIDKLDWESKFPQRQKSLKGRAIVGVAIGNGIVVIGTNSCSVLRWKLNSNGKENDEIEISSKSDDSIDKIYIDPSGYHLLIGLKNGDLYYLHGRANKPKKLSKLQGNIESVAFDANQTSESITKPFLLGTSHGVIYEMVLESSGKEKLCQVVYQLESPSPITAIHFETFVDPERPLNFGLNASMNDVKYLILFATVLPTRLYHTVGVSSFQQVFNDIRERGIPVTELPGDLERAELHAFPPGNALKGKSFALMTGAGIYYGPMMSFLSRYVSMCGRFIILYRLSIFSSSEMMLEAHILPFPITESDISPLSFGFSEFHFIILFPTKIMVMSALNGDFVEEEVFQRNDGPPIAISGDSIRATNIVCTTNSLLQVFTLKKIGISLPLIDLDIYTFR
jgi:vacuolar protein sorting-associated protein 18